MSFITDCFMNIKNMITEEDIRIIKRGDEFAFRNFEDKLIIKNTKKSQISAVIQFLMGVIFLIVSVIEFDVEAKGSMLKVIGSVITISSGALFFLYYRSELGLYKPDTNRLRIIFYLFWNIFTVGGFCLSAAFYISAKSVFVYFIFAAFIVAVPVLRLYENLIAAAVYAVPCIYFGIAENAGAGFYISLAVSLAAFIWVNALKTEYVFRSWNNKRKLKEVNDRCQSLSQVDNQTGMLNRAGLSARIKESCKNNTGNKVAVIMADIDNFRLYNHKFGYEKSDKCLYNICNCIRIISKPVTDIVSRFGGDDFILIFENMDEIEVVRFAEQLRASVERMAIPFGENGLLTMSVGVSTVVELENAETYEKLIKEADIQLIIAKNGGKNCVGCHNHAFIQKNGQEE